VTPGGGVSLSDLHSSSPSSLGNDPKLELAWAEKAGKHAETYWKLLNLFEDTNKFKLTPIDEELYSDFRRTFPDLDVGCLTEETLKNDDSKKKWRNFCNRYEKNPGIVDWNYGTLLRLRSDSDYEDQSNVTIVPRIQFLAIEVARNREGKNKKPKQNSTPKNKNSNSNSNSSSNSNSTSSSTSSSSSIPSSSISPS